MKIGLSLQEQTALGGVLHFAQTPEITLKDGDWINTFEDALRVIGGGAVALARKLFPGVTYPLGVVQSKTWLTPAREQINELIGRLFKAQEGPDDPLSLSRAVGIEVEGKCFYMVPVDPFQFRVIYQVKRKESAEAFAEALLLSIGDRISRLAPGQLRQCPECHRVFVGIGKQRFDTPECSGRFRVGEFRKRKARKQSTHGKRRARR